MSDNDIELDYMFLMQSALRDVVKQVLQITAELGEVPGEHHFYIEFLTSAPGVEVSDALRGAYPEKMTIVLQHKFENLQVFDDRFEVTLHFKGIPDRLVIPFEMVTNFLDPSCDFALRFEPANDGSQEHDPAPDNYAAEETEDSVIAEMPEVTEPEDDDKDNDNAGSADVVSLDAFRKK